MELWQECRYCLYNSQSKRVDSYKDKVILFKKRIRELTESFPNDKASPLMMYETDKNSLRNIWWLS